MKYPFGNGAAYVLCAICGRKVRMRDTIKVRDKYNTLYGLILCKRDIELSNPANRPQPHPRDKTLRQPLLARPEPTDQFGFAATVDEALAGGGSSPTTPTIGPGQVQDLVITGATTTSVSIAWGPATTSGSSGITGYLIERLDPFECTWHTIESSSDLSRTYTDTDTIYKNTEYTYRVSAITDVGTGTASGTAATTTPSS